MMRRARSGFTVIELLIALALGLLLLGSVWALILLLGRQQRVTREATDLTAVGLEVHADLKAELGRAGSGLFAAPNISGVHIARGEVVETSRDTLTILYGTNGTHRVSTSACTQFEGECISLLGEADGIESGDLLLVGSPATGGRLLQVIARSAPHERPCGADCDIVSVCTDAPGVPLSAPVVAGSILHYPDETTVASGAPCAQTYYPDGRWCEEIVSNVQVGTTYTSSCTFSTPSGQVYTDLTVADRTAQFGYPPISTAILRSGAAGTPQVLVQEVGFVRYWVGETSGGSNALFKQTALNPDGSWGVALPLAGMVERWDVKYQHRSASEFERGPIADSASLVLAASNANWVEAASPQPGAVVPAHHFRRSYRDVAAVRVSFTLRAQRGGTGTDEAERASFEVTVATPAILSGGVGF